MRKMLLSFSADVYEKLVEGKKIYEHRKVFPNEPIEAYLYVSSPKKAITGIMHLNNRIPLTSWKEKYAFDKNAVDRIEEYLKSNRYAMEISDFQRTTEIPLEDLRRDLEKFVVPQMYYYIDNTELLDYLNEKLELVGDLLVNDFSEICSDDICRE